MTLQLALEYLKENNFKYTIIEELTNYKIIVDEKDDLLKELTKFMNANQIVYYLCHTDNDISKIQFTLPKKVNLDNYILNKPLEEVVLFLEETNIPYRILYAFSMKTCDFFPGRVSLNVENNLIMSYKIE